MGRIRGGDSYPFSRLGRWSRELVARVSLPHANFTQMAVPPLLPVHGRDSIRPSHIAGSRITVNVETGKYEGRFTSPVFSENHIQPREEGALDS